MKLIITNLLIFLFPLSSISFAQNATSIPIYYGCQLQPEIQRARSKELQDMVDADQKERDNLFQISDEKRNKVFESDLKRRKRVGEILGEGCFKTSADYSAASLIYQHGNAPDHFYQAFIWANRAVELGDLNQRHLVSLTVDRYLVSIGKKQLFGSQANGLIGKCFCLQPVEASFPDSFRKKYSGVSLHEKYDWLASLNQGKNCSNAECATHLKPSPKGTLPGFW